jgi:hypothetical protein
MAITRGTRRGLAAERAGSVPDGEHRVLHDLLREHPLAGDQQNLGERDPAVLGVERGHRVLVAQPDPAQQLQVGSGPVPGAGARFTGVCCAGLC